MPEPVEYRRGDILWIQCDPSVGVEPRKTRTCVVVSNDLANRYGQTVTVIPTQAPCVRRRERRSRRDAPAGRRYAQLPPIFAAICLLNASARLRISSGATSSLWVAIAHL